MTETRLNILLCSCNDTMPIDADTVRRCCRGVGVKTAKQLCRVELERFRSATAEGEPLIVGCTQEEPLFRETAGESRTAEISFVNIRETAGWSDQAADAGPKMAALVAAAAEPYPDVPFVRLESAGVILIYGRDEQAIEAGLLLKDHLDVTVLLNRPVNVMPPRVADFPIAKGTIRAASGHLGNFDIVVDDFALSTPSSRGTLVFAPPRDGAKSHCDILLDISGGPALFAAPDLRDGFVRADPGDPAAILRAVLKARDLVGTFDKPRYVTFTPDLCAHARSGNRRLPSVPRSLSYRRNHTGGRPRRNQRGNLCRLRGMRRGLSDRCGRLRIAAVRRIHAKIAVPVDGLSRSRRQNVDHCFSRQRTRRCDD